MTQDLVTREDICCCQGVTACSRPFLAWMNNNSETGLTCCRHQSNGLFGAILTNNRNLFHSFLSILTPKQLLNCCFHETCFGDTLLIFATSLGRVEMARDLINALLDALNSDHRTDILLSDIIDYESSRGKTPLVEAIRRKHHETVDLLLSFHAESRRPSNLHKRSPLDWARVTGQYELVERINEHHEITDYIDKLFQAISKHDVDEGGARYEWNQDEKFHRELDVKAHSIAAAKRSLLELELELSRVETSLVNLVSEIQYRESKIKTSQSQQHQITSDRVSSTTKALAKVRLALTSDNVLDLLTVEKPSSHEVLVAKGVCTLLRVKNTESNSSSDQDYWQQFKTIVRDKDDFYHRLHHFFFNNEVVSLAANAKVEGCLIICSGYGKPRSEDIAGDTGSTSILLKSIQEWLNVIFQSATGHEEEHRLIREESADTSLLERTKTDHEVMTSSRCILRQEIEHLNASIEFDLTVTAQLQRKVYMSKVMKHVTASGHTILSWAATSGNERIVKQLIKAGAHSGIGEEAISLCAIMIQIWFRRHQLKIAFDKLPLNRKSRELHLEAQCLTMTMRISSLHRIVRRRFSRIRLALLEALFNGHSELVEILREMKRSDENISLFQSVNIASMFCVPHFSIPRLSKVEHWPLRDSNLVSLIIPCIQFQHENDPKSCAYIASLRCAIDLVEEHLMRQRNALNAKIVVRKATLLRKYRQVKTLELKSAMRQEDFVGMVRISNQAGISLDYEDEDTGMTPLILAATAGEKGTYQELRLNNKLVSPVSFLFDRVSPYKPTIGLETRLGVTALSAACSHSHLQAVDELLARGADINQKSVLTKQTPLMTACLVGRIDVVKLLISRGADCNDLSLLHDMALENRHYDICDYLQQLNK